MSVVGPELGPGSPDSLGETEVSGECWGHWVGRLGFHFEFAPLFAPFDMYLAISRLLFWPLYREGLD